MDLIVGGALTVAAVLAAVFGRRLVANNNREKLQVLSALEGQEVLLGISGLGGHTQLIVQRKGRVHVDGSSVVLSGARDRVIPLGQIRWVEDPLTGTRHGNRW